jgi:hypothetical protein
MIGRDVLPGEKKKKENPSCPINWQTWGNAMVTECQALTNGSLQQ